MRNTLRIICIAGIAGSLLLSACEETKKRQSARARPAEVQLHAYVSLQDLPIAESRSNAVPLTAEQRPAVETLIATVEEAFRSGEQNYKSGHLEKARKDFDRAVDALLSSGFDLNADPRLDELLERIVDTIHDYELAAYREGDGFTEQKAEPAPIDEIAEMTFPVDPNLKERAEISLKDLPHDLPITLTDEVLSYLNFFQTNRGRAIVTNGLRRAGRYQDMISRVLREEGVPQDLIFLAQAESGFQPTALSRARALGMWQFVAWRGREYGLKRSWWVDERRDPEKATRAAARHLRDLYEMFGDWYLAIAAYNTGPGNVQKAIERTGYADFWQLYRRNVLLRETKNYVPIIIALTVIAKDAERYGIAVERESPLRVERIKPGHPIDLRLVAETIDISVEELKQLNPQLLRMVTPPDPEFELNLPQGTASRFANEIAVIPQEKWVSWRRHRVEQGETLSAIAKRYRLQPTAIAEANGIDTKSQLDPGQKLIIPAAAPISPERERLGKLIYYRVRRGDTLDLIAEQFSVKVSDLKSWNRLRSDRVARGTSLRIYPGGKPLPARTQLKAAANKSASSEKLMQAKSAAPRSATGEALKHRVKPGESLWSIAKAYQTTVEALREANRFLSSRQLQAGDLLVVVPNQ
jgi:membrane-bound lytic murein transglycosylase D